MGIEPTSEAWEASILPLYDARSIATVANERRTCKNATAFNCPELCIATALFHLQNGVS